MKRPGKRLLLICRHSPYAGQLSHGALDFALAASVFEQDLTLLFMDEGVWQLLPNQQVDGKSIEKTLDSLPLYDLEELHVDLGSLHSRQLSIKDLRGSVTPLSAAELPAFLDSFDRLISC